jgi:hypothetical protein
VGLDPCCLHIGFSFLSEIRTEVVSLSGIELINERQESIATTHVHMLLKDYG